MEQGRAGRILYLDPWSGVSGDMLLGALLDLDRDGRLEWALREAVGALGLPEAGVEVGRGTSGGIACTRVDVAVSGTPPLRSLSDLQNLLEESGLAEAVKTRAFRALARLASVEAGIHGVTVEQVHLHELGAVDTVVDVVGCIALVDALHVDEVVHGPVPLGTGSVVTAHGRLRVPAPATLALLQGVPIFAGPEECEVTTPTGALLLRELAGRCGAMPAMIVEAVGYGGGARTLEHGANVLRAVIGRAASAEPSASAATASSGEPARGRRASEAGLPEFVVELEAVIDDASPEILAYLHQALLSAGALDAWWTPAFMKKGRPGFELTVLCRPVDEVALVETIFRESTTFGVRRSERSRHVLDREWVQVDVDGETVRVKVGRLNGRAVTVAPEFEDAARAAAGLGTPLADVMATAAASARAILGG
ncbi:MAG TPA: nickel pincer cofactor biosynthesis protein LarC [Thermoleophilia bacterium]|nr:nickel pincer cofactor biosynthesis protein LarC [Thermoleophilia bacterium]